MGEESSTVMKGNVKYPVVAGTVPYLDCITVKILIVILSYSFARCCHWGKLAKDTKDLSLYFLKLQMKLQLSKNKRFNFFKKIIRNMPCLIGIHLHLPGQMLGEKGDAHIRSMKPLPSS